MMQMQMQKVLKETCQFEWLTVQTVNTLEQLAEDNANVSKTGLLQNMACHSLRTLVVWIKYVETLVQ